MQGSLNGNTKVLQACFIRSKKDYIHFTEGYKQDDSNQNLLQLIRMMKAYNFSVNNFLENVLQFNLMTLSNNSLNIDIPSTVNN